MWSNLEQTAYHWNARRNFGDELTPLLLQRFAGLDPEWGPPETARCVVVGSIVEHLPLNYAGFVAGVGKLYEDTVVNLPKATILGLRGPLTAKGVPGDFVLGDPGLLANELVGPVEQVYNLGVVGHWSDRALAQRPEFLRWDPLIIDPAGDPLTVIRQIGSCKKVVSSSLHGIVVADAFGIPRRTEMAAQFEREGGPTKFIDYNATIGVKFVVGKTQQPDYFRVQNKQAELFDMLEALGRAVTGKKRGA